jgi:hypothetical protein
VRHVLVILTRPADALGEKVLELQQSIPDTSVETIDLTVDAPDYARLLDRMFEADSVQVW